MTTDRLSTTLRKRGHKLTPQRRAVLEVIANSHDHLTPAAIYERVRQNCPGIGLVTIYRVLDILADLDLVCQLHTEDGRRTYLIRTEGEHHHHVVCLSCGRVEDFTGCDLGGTQRRLVRKTGFKIQSHVLQFSGLCPDCRSHSTHSTGSG